MGKKVYVGGLLWSVRCKVTMQSGGGVSVCGGGYYGMSGP